VPSVVKKLLTYLWFATLASNLSPNPIFAENYKVHSSYDEVLQSFNKWLHFQTTVVRHFPDLPTQKMR